MKLYHVTNSALLPSIKQFGLDPSKSKEPQFRDRNLYLSNDLNHALGYVDHHGDWSGVLILEIDSKDLNQKLLGPDDVDLPDILSQQGDENWYEYSWEESLKICSQCTYSGIIPWNIINTVHI